MDTITVQVGMPIIFFPGEDDHQAKTNQNDGPVAAVVTRVWGDGVINLMAFPDCGEPICFTSVTAAAEDSPTARTWKPAATN